MLSRNTSSSLPVLLLLLIVGSWLMFFRSDSTTRPHQVFGDELFTGDEISAIVVDKGLFYGTISNVSIDNRREETVVTIHGRGLHHSSHHSSHRSSSASRSSKASGR